MGVHTNAWQNISDAVEFYGEEGFSYTDVPWLVKKDVNKLTCEDESKIAFVRAPRISEHDTLVGSGEQGLLRLLSEGHIVPEKRYMTVTPCFRLQDVGLTEYHYPYFHKLELGALHSDKNKASDELNFIMLTADKFLSSFFSRDELEIVAREGGTYDIEVIDRSTTPKFVELGSYGIRTLKQGYWVYGTGIAEPRLSAVLHTYPSGYHVNKIRKGEYGHISKVVEELRELKDAIDQNNKMLILNEMSDLLGAVEGLIERLLKQDTQCVNGGGTHVNFNDLTQMVNATRRAFLSGDRS